MAVRDCRVSSHGRREQPCPWCLHCSRGTGYLHPARAGRGHYDLKTVVTVSVVQFALFFTDFWFQLARWMTAPSSTRSMAGGSAGTGRTPIRPVGRTEQRLR
ncbi:hypothetical protein CSC43_6908 [Pseudomonas aeruginosa]|nr:hypothetical protein CSC43_6908 [Pseudomonas aeruginosa]